MAKVKFVPTHTQDFWTHDLKQSQELTANTPSILVECECGFQAYILPDTWKHYQRERRTKKERVNE